MIAVKLVLCDEARRAQIFTEDDHISFSLLVNTAQNLFPSLRGKPNVDFYWKDEDDDIIIVSSNEELAEAARIMTHDNRSVMRFEIRENSGSVPHSLFQISEPPTPTVTARAVNLATHSNVRCDCCDLIPIVGTRYKCAVREDFDLCESCENRNLQPHPMIKIYSPDQAPAAIFVALKGDECPRGPLKGSNHRGHGPHGQHHRPLNGHFDVTCPLPTWESNNRGPFTQPVANSSQDLPFGPYPGGVWRRAMRQQARRNSEACGHGQGGWAATAGEYSKSVAGGFPHAFNGSAAGNTSEAADHHDDVSKTEEDFLEEAVRQSLEVSSSTKVATHLNEDIPLHYSPPVAIPPSIANTKPMNRFVMDVTFPDGTSVQPGSVFLKTWRIRNDGANPWPENVVLCCAGGDYFSSPDLKLPVDPLLPGAEADITLQLSAPERSGRHVAYFRMRTGDGVWFGQKLWADIRVVEDDQGWQLLGGMLGTNVSSPSLSRADSLSSKQDTMAQAEELLHDAEVTVHDTPSALQVAHAVLASTNANAIPEGVNEPDARLHSDLESLNELDSQTSVVAVWTRVWTKELQILVEMGFTDTVECVRLLQQHLGIPSSLTPADSHVSPEGMQNVIAALLSE